MGLVGWPQLLSGRGPYFRFSGLSGSPWSSPSLGSSPPEGRGPGVQGSLRVCSGGPLPHSPDPASISGGSRSLLPWSQEQDTLLFSAWEWA